MRAASVVVLLLSVVAVASSGWLLFGHVPAAVDADGKARSETARQQALTDAIAGHALALAVFSRDYGEVQALLTRYAELGYVSRALVTNADRAVVASVGPFPEAGMGDRLPDSLAASGRAIRLTVRTEVYGELRIYLPVPEQTGAGPGAATLRWVVAGLFALATLILVLTAVSLSRRD